MVWSRFRARPPHWASIDFPAPFWNETTTMTWPAKRRATGTTAALTIAATVAIIASGCTSSVIDLETQQTASEGWRVQPLSSIPSWTLVAASTGTSSEQSFLACGSSSVSCSFVRDGENGGYAGRWW